MDTREKYLLRTKAEEMAFRARFAKQIEQYRDSYEQWFLGSFRLYQWRRIVISPENTEFVLGLLCLLYREGRIQFSLRFSSPGTVDIQREEVAGHT